MKKKNRLKAWLIFGIYFAATCALILGCYSVQKPAVRQQEFPFTITYSYQGKTETISDVYVAEYSRVAKYIGDEPTAWYGYVKDKDRLAADFYRIAENDGEAFSINLNIEPGYVMGDPRYAGMVCQPSGVYHSIDETRVTDAAQLERMGFTILGWEYPYPIDNAFSFGGISLSSEATMLTSALAVVTLLACVVFVKKERRSAYGGINKVSIALNYLVIIFAFPFIFITSALSEILADASALQQVLYLAPALTALGVAASVTLRRMEHKKLSFWIQFAGPAVFVAVLLLGVL